MCLFNKFLETYFPCKLDRERETQIDSPKKMSDLQHFGRNGRLSREKWAQQFVTRSGDSLEFIPRKQYFHNVRVIRASRLKPVIGDRFLSSADTGKNCALSTRVPNPSPVLDKNRSPMGPEIVSSTGAGVWRKAPKGFPDSSSVLDKFQSNLRFAIFGLAT